MNAKPLHSSVVHRGRGRGAGDRQAVGSAYRCGALLALLVFDVAAFVMLALAMPDAFEAAAQTANGLALAWR